MKIFSSGVNIEAEGQNGWLGCSSLSVAPSKLDSCLYYRIIDIDKHEDRGINENMCMLYSSCYLNRQ